MKIAAIILTMNDAELTSRAAASVAPCVEQVYIVDNGSPGEVLQQLEDVCDREGYTLIPNGANIGYGRGNNRGIARALADGCEALLIMNNDAFARDGAVEALAGYLAEHQQVAAVGPMVLGVPSGDVMHTASAIDLETGHSEWIDHKVPLDEVDMRPRPTGYLSGEAFLARSEVIRQVGAFDERFHIYFEDSEWSIRVRRAGWELHVVPQAVFDHVWGSALPSVRGAFYRAQSRVLFMQAALGKSRWRAAWMSLRPTVGTMLGLIRGGRPGDAMKGCLWGWITGVARLVRRAPAH